MKVYNDIEEVNKVLVKTVQSVRKHDDLTPYEINVLVDVTAYLPKLLSNYNTMLKYLKDKCEVDTLCSLSEIIHNEKEAEKATKILQEIGEV